MPGMTVYIVADRNFGERLQSLVETGPVWIISSGANTPAAKRWWAAHPQALKLQRSPVTDFIVPDGQPADQWFPQTLKDVELHFGGSEGVAPLYDGIEVWGMEITPTIRSDVVSRGYAVVKEWPTGFRVVIDERRSIAHA